MNLLPKEILLYICEYLDEHNKTSLSIVNHKFNYLVPTINKLFDAIINHKNIDLNKYRQILMSVEEIFLKGCEIKITIGSAAKIIAKVYHNNMFDKYDNVPINYILTWAIITDHKNITRVIIYWYENLSNIKNGLVCLAIQYGSVSMLKFLIEIIQIDFSKAICSAYNPLEQASICGHLVMVEYLFQYDKNIENHHRALYAAVEKGYLNIVKFFVDSGCLADKNKILNMADERKYLNMIEYLINNDYFADVNKSKIFNLATKYGFLNIVENMIKSDYPIDINKDRILNIAVNNNSESVVKYLLDKYY